MTALKKMVGKDIVMLVAQTSLPEGSPEAFSLVRTIREAHPPVDGELMVTGESAFQADFIQTIKDHSPLVIGLIVLVTYFVLFLLLGSLLLPLKAVLMNTLSISASYGALVWIFQYGHLASWLHFTPGPIEPMTPIIMFCILFGLSMDYEVLLLSRVREEYEKTCDNTRAVARGLERTGRMITGAAAIMALVLFAFGLADLTVVKAMGIGMGIAVVIDATIVRTLLVPATMRLLGRWNWWAPRPMVRLYRHVALGETGGTLCCVIWSLHHQESVGGKTRCEHDRVDVSVFQEYGRFPVSGREPEILYRFGNGAVLRKVFDLLSDLLILPEDFSSACNEPLQSFKSMQPDGKPQFTECEPIGSRGLEQAAPRKGIESNPACFHDIV